MGDLHVMQRAHCVRAAIRLAVLDEDESEEEVIFNQRTRTPQAEWSLDAEETSNEYTQHRRGSKRKVSGAAHSDVAFSSPLVGWLRRRTLREWVTASNGRGRVYGSLGLIISSRLSALSSGHRFCPNCTLLRCQQASWSRRLVQMAEW